MLWKIKHWFKQRYIKRKYVHADKRIVYDHWLRGYIHPDYTANDGYFDIENLADDICGIGLCYECMVDGEYCHSHKLSDVIETAYNEGDAFVIPVECEGDYSRQELDLLRRLAEMGAAHRGYYGMADNLDNGGSADD